MGQSIINWSQLHSARMGVRKRYHKIWDLPIEKRYAEVLFKCGRDHARVLEVGAGNRALHSRLRNWWPNTQYKSYDIDSETEQDFYQLEDIDGDYNIICMFEVIEHVPPAIAKEILTKCYEVMAPGGLIFITTPNIYYPPNYLRDATHITPWCYDELGAVSSMSGFELKDIYRLYSDSFWGKLLHRVLFYSVHKVIGIDFAKHLLLVAQKP